MRVTQQDAHMVQSVAQSTAVSTAPPERPAAWRATQLSTDEMLRLAQDALFGNLTTGEEGRGLRWILAALATFPGDTWQERWISSGCDGAAAEWVTALGTTGDGLSDRIPRRHLTAGLVALLCLDVVRPGYSFLNQVLPIKASQIVRQTRDPDFTQKAIDYGQEQALRARTIGEALLVISKIMLHTGSSAAEITPADVLEYRHVTQNMRGIAVGTVVAWELLTRFGTFPQGTVPLRDAARIGPLSTADLVASYQLKCRPVEEMLVRYLDERAPTLDHTSLRGLATVLVKTFWKDLEQHHPGIECLDLSQDVATAWKMRVHAAFQDPWKVLIVVRAFYLDIAHLAMHDAYWVAWAVRSPVSAADTRGSSKYKKHARARMHQRIRSLAPHFPALVRSAGEQLEFESGLLAAAREAEPGSCFSYQGREYEHVQLKRAPDDGGAGREARRIWLRDPAGDKRVDQGRQEDCAFWTWAVINTLYYTGMRLEELSELTSIALTMYQPSGGGQPVPLLQIAPSKTDEERVLIIPPELVHVLARIKSRLRAGGRAVPLVVRYDHYEHTLSAPLPFLFQRRNGVQRRVMSPRFAGRMLEKLIARVGITDANGDPIHVTPHDFRRVFATEALVGGLPIHIVAKLLGHKSLMTTESYTAVYPEDVMRHYRSFIARRRSLRPSEEYRDPTPDEWEEFHRHFHKRKIELGNCGRGYATPCAHEHACIRCPMLRPDPSQRPRLEEIAANLGERLEEARARGWLGEVEGIEVSMSAAQEKLDRMSHIVSLGLPRVRGEANE